MPSTGNEEHAARLLYGILFEIPQAHVLTSSLCILKS